MKKNCIFYIILFIAQIGFSQTLPFSTLRQVFNYSVGDSFEYSYDNYGSYSIQGSTGNYTCGGNSLLIITSLSSSGNSLFYQFKYVWNDANDEYVCNSPFNYVATPQYPFSEATFNDSIFSLSSPDSLTSSLYSNCNVAQICIDSVLKNSNYNNHKQNYYHQLWGVYQTLGDSIGVINKGWFEEDNKSGSDLQLIWYHKVNGDQWGTSVKIIPLGLNKLDKAVVSARLFPNPSYGKFSIQLSDAPNGGVRFELFDLSGQTIYTQKIVSQLTEIKLNECSSGLYLWQLLDDNTVLGRSKVVIE